MDKTVFIKLITGWESASVDCNELRTLVDRYPWFAPATAMLAGVVDDATEREVLRRSIALNSFVCSYRRYLSPPKSVTDEVIGRFLNNYGMGKRIAPLSHDPKISSLLEVSTEAKTGDEIEVVSETLAQIYKKQALFDQSIEIYNQLCLKYPEKSVYFASEIAEMELLKKTMANHKKF